MMVTGVKMPGIGGWFLLLNDFRELRVILSCDYILISTRTKQKTLTSERIGT